MESTEKQTWEQVRARGRGHFVWREGILRYGLLSGGIFAFGWFLKDLLKHQLDGSETLAIAAMSAAVTLACGWTIGTLLWQGREKEFHNR